LATKKIRGYKSYKDFLGIVWLNSPYFEETIVRTVIFRHSNSWTLPIQNKVLEKITTHPG
jgi:hypothetical protein